MIGRKRLVRAIAVISVAVATGQTVESLRPTAKDVGKTGTGVSGADILPSSASLVPAGSLPDIRGITPVAAASEAADRNACVPSLALASSAGAMIDVSLRAPCNADERVVIRHAGIPFTAQMGADGRLSLTLPALERNAVVAAYFEGSAIALATVEIPDVEHQSRFAFQAPYPVEFQLRAEEGETLHLGGASGSGRILILGSDQVAEPHLAQVYTFPGVDLASSSLSVKVRVTEQTCGRSFKAETRVSQGGAVTAQTLPVTMPICGMSGDNLVLKNLLSAVTLAAPK
jgi:hypothetical protein